MALDVQTNILNGQQSAVGTGGFDLRQILGVSNLETVPSALDTTSALTSSTTSAPSFDSQQEQLINEVNEMIDDMLANRTASGGDELVAMLASGLAARLPAGASTQAVNAILLEAERRDRIDGGGLSSNTWEELKDRTQKERAEQAKMADFADDAMNAQQIDQNDYSQTYSNDQLDSMEWQGDPNQVWNIGGVSLSRESLFRSGKRARTNWANSAEARGMSAEDRARVDHQFSEYLQAIKNGDRERALRIYGEMPPGARADVDRTNRIESVSVDPSLQSQATVAVNSSASVVNGNALITGGAPSGAVSPTAAASILEFDDAPARPQRPAGDIQTNIALSSSFNFASSGANAEVPALQPAVVPPAAPRVEVASATTPPPAQPAAPPALNTNFGFS